MNKKYLYASLTLGIIAAVAAGVIGLTNYFTKDRIVENEKKATIAGLEEIFGKEATYGEATPVKEKTYKYVYEYYLATKNDSFFGYVFKGSGYNDYGKITALIGIKPNLEVKKYYVIVNDQTFGSTFMKNYINPFNEGNRDLDDVTCGATYSATLINSMAHESLTEAERLLSEENK